MKTFGWDTVSLIDISCVNAALAAQSGNLRMRFDADLQSDPPVTTMGEYQQWSIVPGGSGRLLYVALAIKSGTLNVGHGTPSPLLAEFSIPPRAVERKSYDLAGVTAVFSIDLRLLTGAVSQAQDLLFDLSKVSYTMPPPGDGYVTPVKVIDPSGKLDVASRSLLGATLADDLVRHADQVRFVFAHINPVPPATDSWLAPTASSYAYVERVVGGKNYLGVMSVTDGRSIEGLEFTIDPEDTQDQFTSSFVISGDLVLRKMIMPILPQAYSTAGDTFYFDAGSHMIRNSREFGTFSVKSGAITYHPVIEKFEMCIDATGIRSQVWGRCDMKAGIWMTFHVNTWNQAVFDPKTSLLTFLPDPKPISSSSADIPWYFYFLGILVTAITEICVRTISSSIAGQLNDLLRSALAITQNPPKIVNWQGSDGFEVQTAGLNSSLYMMGQSRGS
jgi:hypothetical protein